MNPTTNTDNNNRIVMLETRSNQDFRVNRLKSKIIGYKEQYRGLCMKMRKTGKYKGRAEPSLVNPNELEINVFPNKLEMK